MAVSVKDFLDAIRGRYQDEPNKVEVTGSVVAKEPVYIFQGGFTSSGSTRVIADVNNASRILTVKMVANDLENFRYIFSLKKENGDYERMNGRFNFNSTSSAPESGKEIENGTSEYFKKIGEDTQGKSVFGLKRDFLDCAYGFKLEIRNDGDSANCNASVGYQDL